MYELSLIDTHCDTASELYHRGQSLFENDCHVSLKKAEKYTNYAHFFAVWADKRRSDDECYGDFLKIAENLSSLLQKEDERAAQVRNYSELTEAWNTGKRAIFLAVEDARILSGDLSRLDMLKELGVTYLTLLWGGPTCIGASHDTEGGLTDFGRAVVVRCFELGIIPDVSHANERVTDEVCEMARSFGKPFMASHSNCFEVYPHTRNLRKQHLQALIELGGSVGLNLCPWHLGNAGDRKITISDVMRHIEGFLELGAEKNLGLGCDLDGTDLPQGFSGISDLSLIAEEMAKRNYSDDLIEDIFFRNNLKFIQRSLR